jgi:hypothetical protein
MRRLLLLSRWVLVGWKKIRKLLSPQQSTKLAAARKLAVRLYWMLRTQTGYPGIVRIESSPPVPLAGAS